MQVGAYCYLAAALICALIVTDIDCIPTHVIPNTKKEGLKIQDASNQSGQNVDQDVKDLENLKPLDSGMSVVKSHSSIFTDINGKKEGQYEAKEELNKGGKLLARIDQKMKQEDDGSAPTPLTYIRTEVEIPHRGIHKVIESNEQPSPSNNLNILASRKPGNIGLDLAGIGIGDVGNMNMASTAAATKRRMLLYPHVESDENVNTVNTINLDPYKSYSGVQFSPLDMAEYIFWTGDEKGVTLAIEEFLVQGMMSREEAISYLHDIKTNLEYLQKQYSEEQAQRENPSREQAVNPLRKNLGFLEKARQARNEANELMEMRQQMRENFNKKSMESMEPDSSQLKQRLFQAGSQGISDEDYEDLLERLRVADFLYTEYSLEEVIYQLAKVMFSQSLTRGSSEAQEALEKFTRFLETEAEMGRISRGLEKKVLDVLIAGLTDTLTEHPELVAVARESLGGIGTNSVEDQLLQQLLILNPSTVDKTDSVKNENGMKFNNLKNHRFMMANKNRISEQLPIPMKKSSVPASSSANQDGKSLHKST